LAAEGQRVARLNVERCQDSFLGFERKIPIEDIHLGDRIQTENSRSWEYDDTFSEPDRENWRSISMTVQKSDRTVVDIEWLRPRSWMESHGLQPGRTIQVVSRDNRIDGWGTVNRISESGILAHNSEPCLVQKTDKAGEILSAPKGAGAFADEAARIMEASARSRGFGTNSGIQAAMKPREIDLTKLRPSLSKDFADPVKLEAHGPFDWNKYTPIIVEDLGGGLFRLQEGMTRWENALLAGINKLPAYVFPKSGG